VTIKKDSDDDSGEGGKSSGEIQFRYKDILSEGPRDDVLSEGEIKRLLLVHQELHKDHVDKQKATRAERKALKEGKTPAFSSQSHRIGGSSFGGSASPYKKHPITNKAQFSGIDSQVSAIPSENNAETNADAKEKLENQNRNVLRHAPKFNPKPRPY